MTQEKENYDTQNIVPLSSDEIQSILKSQSEIVFEDKNISNNSSFVKKSLIDIALDFKSKQKNQDEEDNDKILDSLNNSQKENNNTKANKKIEDLDLYKKNESDNKTNNQVETEQSKKSLDINNISETNLDQIKDNIQSQELLQDRNIVDVESVSQKQQEETLEETKPDEIKETDNDTQQALDSVRDAVSQSINKSEDKNTKTLEENNELSNDELETIKNDYEDFKNILSSLPKLAEEAVFEVFQKKILQISYELAGYQIDKMPEKYEKKIKSFLKNMNCYQDKITVEINDKDFEALSKIKNFKKNEEKNFFIPNKELSRGDIILNCDGMYYSEKSDHSA